MTTHRSFLPGLFSIILLGACSQKSLTDVASTSAKLTLNPIPQENPELIHVDYFAQTGDAALDKIMKEIEDIEKQVDVLSSEMEAEVRRKIQNASCQELSSYAAQQRRQLNYWRNAPTVGTGLSSRIPQARAKGALNTLNLISAEYSRRC